MVASEEQEKVAFAIRLGEALTEAGIPDDRQRRGTVAAMFGVSRETARKWLTGEAIPATKRIPIIARRLNVRGEWLLTGKSPKRGSLAIEGSPDGAHELSAEQDVVLPPTEITAIPVMDARGSMGHGVLAPEHDTILDFMRVSTAWLRRNLTVSQPRNLAVITAYGDSMSPTFNDGDILLVDRGIIDLRLDAVYVLERDGELYVKRVQRRLDGALIIKSDNPLYDPTVIDSPEAAGLRVLGRVVWAWNGKRL